MSRKPGADMRAQRSRKWLYEALLQLMKEKPFRDIQITEIADRAQVARPTFYLHYRSKEELLLSQVDVVFAEFLEELSHAIAAGNDDRLKYSILMFQYWERNAETLRTVMQAALHEEFRERLRKYFSLVVSQLTTLDGTPKPDEQTAEFIVDFESGGAYQLLTKWIERGMPYSAGQMGSLFYQLVVAGQTARITP
ncbi:MAG: TetR/AcrR family transcriptional regulator [Anaerolineales bacterium]